MSHSAYASLSGLRRKRRAEKACKSSANNQLSLFIVIPCLVFHLYISNSSPCFFPSRIFTVVLIPTPFSLLNVDSHRLFHQHPLYASSPDNLSLSMMMTHKSTRTRKPLTIVSTDLATTREISTVIHWLTFLFCLAAMITFIYFHANHFTIPDHVWGVLACFFIVILVVQLIIFLQVRSYKKRIVRLKTGNSGLEDISFKLPKRPQSPTRYDVRHDARHQRRERRYDGQQRSPKRQKEADWNANSDKKSRRAHAQPSSIELRLMGYRPTEKYGNSCKQYEVKPSGRVQGRSWSLSRSSIEKLEKEEMKAIEKLVEEGRLGEYRKAKMEKEMRDQQHREKGRMENGKKWTVWPFAQIVATPAPKDERGRTSDQHGQRLREREDHDNLKPKRLAPPPAQQPWSFLNPFFGASTFSTNVVEEMRAASPRTCHPDFLSVPKPAHYRPQDRSPKAADGAIGKCAPYQQHRPKEAKGTAFPAPSSLARPIPPQPTRPLFSSLVAHPAQAHPVAKQAPPVGLPRHHDPEVKDEERPMIIIEPTPSDTIRRKKEESTMVIGYGGETVTMNLSGRKSDEGKEGIDGQEAKEKERRRWGSLPQGIVGTGLLAHPTESVLTGYKAWHHGESSKAKGKDRSVEYIAWNPTTMKRNDLRRLRRGSHDEESAIKNWKRREDELGFEIEEKVLSQDPRTRLEIRLNEEFRKKKETKDLKLRLKRGDAGKEQREDKGRNETKEKKEIAARCREQVRAHTKDLKLEAEEEGSERERRDRMGELCAKAKRPKWKENERPKEKGKEDAQVVEVLRRRLHEREVKEDREYVERLKARNSKVQESRKDRKRKAANSANVFATEKIADEFQQMMVGSKRTSQPTNATLPSALESEITKMFERQPAEETEWQRTKQLERQYEAFEAEQAREDLEEMLQLRKASTLSMWEKDYQRDRGSSFGVGSKFTSFTGFTREGSGESKHSMGSQEMIAEVQTNMKTLEKRREKAAVKGNWSEEKRLKAEIEESTALLKEYRALAADSGDEKGAHADPAQRAQDPRIPRPLPGTIVGLRKTKICRK